MAFPALRILLVLALPLLLSGCYYLQAAGGQLEVLQKRESIEGLLDDPDTSEALAARLSLIRDVREFSIAELGLPDNDSYRTFADLERDYVVWNVIAAPELSVEARTWCFPVAGCVAYRGYFSERRARAKAEQLEAKGYDVFVGGVTAYSTLGTFDDPVLNTMLRRDDIGLVALLFHELAHQVLYVRGDTAFNESFATAVEELGVERWLDGQALEDQWQRYRSRKALADELTGLALEARDDLAALYSGPLPADEKRRAKSARLEELAAALGRRAVDHGVDPNDAWFAQPLNNARLAVWSAYESHVPAFRRLFRDCGEDFRCFYESAGELAELDADERSRRLAALAARQSDPAL